MNVLFTYQASVTPTAGFSLLVPWDALYNPSTVLLDSPIKERSTFKMVMDIQADDDYGYISTNDPLLLPDVTPGVDGSFPVGQNIGQAGYSLLNPIQNYYLGRKKYLNFAALNSASTGTSHLIIRLGFAITL